MKNLLNLKNFSALGGLLLMFSSCEPNQDDLSSSSEIMATNAMADIQPEDLEGQWKISAMKTDTAVDLNGDNVYNSNVLLEANGCFADMGVTFYPDGSMTTTNSKLDFKAGTTDDEFKCLSGRTDTGEWEVENVDGEQRLLITMSINGDSYTHSRVLERTDDDTFAFEISKLESQQYYGSPEGTDAEPVKVLSLEYSRVY